MYNKRGQISLFIIIGIVLLMIVGGFLVIFNKLEKEPPKEEIKSTGSDSKQLNSFVSLCVKDVVEEGFNTLGFRENALEQYMNYNIQKCTNKFSDFEKQGYEVKISTINSFVDISENSVSAYVDYPVQIYLGDFLYESDTFNHIIDRNAVYKLNIENEKTKATHIIRSPDRRMELIIPADTYVNTDTITISMRKNDYDKDENAIMIPFIYEFSQATFYPAATLVYTYDDKLLPALTDKTSLTISYYDKDSRKMVQLPGEVDTNFNKITSSVEHFTDVTVTTDCSCLNKEQAERELELEKPKIIFNLSDQECIQGFSCTDAEITKNEENYAFRMKPDDCGEDGVCYLAFVVIDENKIIKQGEYIEEIIEDSISNYYHEKNIGADYAEVEAEVNSIKVNDDEQLQNSVLSTKGSLSNSEEFYKYFSTKSFACAPKQSGETQDEYCYVDITVSKQNENVNLLVLKEDFSSTPCAIIKEYEKKEQCLSPELIETNYKNNIVRVSNNEEKIISIECDQDIMVRPFLETTSQRWTEVCENPAIMIIQESETSRNLLDWQRTDVDEWENAYILNREECDYDQKKNSLQAAYMDYELDWEMARNRANCNFEPVEDRCYWIEAKAGTTLLIKLSDATENSFVEVAYRNCDCYCNEEENACYYEHDSCSPKPLRDLECPDLLISDCAAIEGAILPDGLPSCGGRGGGYSGDSMNVPEGFIDLGEPYDTAVCFGPHPNYCARDGPVDRSGEKETTCYGDDLVKQHYWGRCSAEASCPTGFISETGQECTGKPEEADCVFGCVWQNDCEVYTAFNSEGIYEEDTDGEGIYTDPNLPFSLSEVTWLHTNVASWSITSKLSSVNIGSSTITLNYDKANSWPGVDIGDNTIVNANPWVFVKYNGKWYAATWEWLRVGSITKNRVAVNGDHIKQPPLNTWSPSSGEKIGFMVSGLARGSERNVQQRTNIIIVTWP
jgi:hypothetical protein